MLEFYGLVNALFGAEAVRLLQDNLLLVSGGAAALGGLLLAWGLFSWLRAFRRALRSAGRTLGLWRSRQGREGLRLAGEIRATSRRVRAHLREMGVEPRERNSLTTLLDKFTREELPKTLSQALRFIQALRGRNPRKLQAVLDVLRSHWSEAADAAARERLQREIATVQQQLTQSSEAETGCTRLVEGLRDAAAALAALEIELASLDATRSPGIGPIERQITSLAEDLKIQREVYRSLEDL